ncbi:hypothetical protein [Nonlabens dokdonensis]|uniref:hypothetical protein n=1 Tax=Nonlabens dokdonensis TaxID=328515 RepID=UPI0026EC512F|nr:hypothetical protein [Nonlabens dokdonensis]
MQYSGPYAYTLFLSGSEENRFIEKKVQGGKVTSFKRPVTLDKTPKIYILKHQDQIVYVGYASQSIGTRLGQGIRAAGLNGYHGYKWKEVDELELLVCVFHNYQIDSENKRDCPYIAFAEAVEAELVYKVRQETGRWPEFQNEIHFNNIGLEKAKEVALDINTKATL